MKVKSVDWMRCMKEHRGERMRGFERAECIVEETYEIAEHELCEGGV